MKHRNPAAVFFLPIITFGIYGIVWHVKTKNEMNRLGANIPTAWLIIIPFVSWYWLWKYSQGVERVTKEQMSGVLAFVLLFLLGLIGMAILQSEFNKIDSASAAVSPVTDTPTNGQVQPDSSFGGPAVVAPSTPTPASTNNPTSTSQPPQVS